MRGLRQPHIEVAGRRLSPWWLAAAMAAMALFLLALAASADNVSEADLWIARRVQDIDFAGWRPFLEVGDWLTGSPGGVLVWLILAAGLWLSGLPTAAATIVLGAGVGVPQHFLEEFASRPRPTTDLVEVTQIVVGFSFPSGHVTAGVSVYGMLTIIAALSVGPRWAKAATMGLVAAVLVSSALARVAFGAHWPSDVLGGLLLGLVWLIVLTRFHFALERSGLVNYVPLARVWQRGRTD